MLVEIQHRDGSVVRNLASDINWAKNPNNIESEPLLYKLPELLDNDLVKMLEQFISFNTTLATDVPDFAVDIQPLIDSGQSLLELWRTTHGQRNTN